jgi:Na+-translocating ferredoxin:NAD+ oxidoreductase RnfG subunit
MKKETVHVSHVWTSLIIALIIVVAGLLAGCATNGTYGTLERSQELNQKFLNYEVLPDYNYYSSGGYDRPDAILGIQKDYQLVSDLWEPAQISSAQMAKWIQAIDPESYRGPVGYFAAYILDPDGKKVGIWYSIQNTTTVKFLEGKKIEVYTPTVLPRMNIRR